MAPSKGSGAELAHEEPTRLNQLEGLGSLNQGTAALTPRYCCFTFNSGTLDTRIKILGKDKGKVKGKITSAEKKFTHLPILYLIYIIYIYIKYIYMHV